MTPGTRTDRERGATAILVAGVLVFLMAFAWLAIDAGLGFDDRRGTQNAADLAALAGAWEACNPAGTGVETAALDVAAANGYVHDPGAGTQVDVIHTSGTSERVRVAISERNDSIFGGAGNAPDSLEVQSEATAECEEIGFLGDFAVFGGHDGVCPTPNLPDSQDAIVELDAGDVTVTGDVHSNERLYMGGSSPMVIGTASYRDTVWPSGFPAEQHFGAPLDYPLELAVSEFAPGGSRVAGLPPDRYHDLGSFADEDDVAAVTDGGLITNLLVGNVLTINVPGVYYADDEIDLSGITVVPGLALLEGVTFVSGGQIDLGQVTSLNGYSGAPVVPGGNVPILAFSADDSECDPGAIVLRADGGILTGLLYAPEGDIQINKGPGNPPLAVNGSIIGYEISFITISGELGALVITYQDDAVPPEYRVELID